MKKALSILSASVLSISLLAACTPAAPATTAGGTTPGTTPSTTTAAAGEVTYAVLLKNQSSDFWVKMKQGVEAKAKELNVKVDILAAQSEEDTRVQKSFPGPLTLSSTILTLENSGPLATAFTMMRRSSSDTHNHSSPFSRKTFSSAACGAYSRQATRPKRGILTSVRCLASTYRS